MLEKHFGSCRFVYNCKEG
ncbi:MAG: helix-turn-helix domain-containing protein [Thermoprotei archaeon]